MLDAEIILSRLEINMNQIKSYGVEKIGLYGIKVLSRRFVGKTYRFSDSRGGKTGFKRSYRRERYFCTGSIVSTFRIFIML